MDMQCNIVAVSNPGCIDEKSSSFLLLCLIGFYSAYYLLTARSVPKVYSQASKIADFFMRKMPVVTEVYAPCFWGFSGRVQTILRPLVKWTSMPIYDIETLNLSDGGEVHLSWNKPMICDDSTPIIVILPGITGCSCSRYISFLVKTINSLGYKCVVLNCRGTCMQILKTPKTFCATYIIDLSEVIQHIQARYPDAPLAAVGISLGGVTLFNYVASFGMDEAIEGKENFVEKSTCPLKAAMCICMPWAPIKTCETMENVVDWLFFNYPLTWELCDIVKRNKHVLSTKFDVPRILRSRSVKEFDENLTAVMFGYNSPEDYYNHASPATKLDKITIPIICLNAADDPFVPLSSIPLAEISESKNVVCVLTKRGGHIGFMDSFWPTGPNLMDRAVQEFASAVFEHPNDLEAAMA